jgi:UDP-N-acetyl-2-amino-2-deoxyglucuronate dehydrogenase
MYKFALLGCGRISKNHIESLAELKKEGKAEFVACCDIIPERPILLHPKLAATLLQLSKHA